mmetsp:Transcript_17081/g.59803  ORF Transcript_17081/g.59803 Transcript_17081/m.59803 type:complete len:310 (+) Transcript_17081:232-1161(+)
MLRQNSARHVRAAPGTDQRPEGHVHAVGGVGRGVEQIDRGPLPQQTARSNLVRRPFSDQVRVGHRLEATAEEPRAPPDGERTPPIGRKSLLRDTEGGAHLVPTRPAITVEGPTEAEEEAVEGLGTLEELHDGKVTDKVQTAVVARGLRAHGELVVLLPPELFSDPELEGASGEEAAVPQTSSGPHLAHGRQIDDPEIGNVAAAASHRGEQWTASVSAGAKQARVDGDIGDQRQRVVAGESGLLHPLGTSQKNHGALWPKATAPRLRGPAPRRAQRPPQDDQQPDNQCCQQRPPASLRPRRRHRHLWRGE